MKKVIAIVSIPINESCLIVDIESPVVVGRFMPDVVLDSDIDIDIDIDILLIELILTMFMRPSLYRSGKVTLMRNFESKYVSNSKQELRSVLCAEGQQQDSCCLEFTISFGSDKSKGPQ